MSNFITRICKEETGYLKVANDSQEYHFQPGYQGSLLPAPLAP